jgi:hypothetical protein
MQVWSIFFIWIPMFQILWNWSGVFCEIRVLQRPNGNLILLKRKGQSLESLLSSPRDLLSKEKCIYLGFLHFKPSIRVATYSWNWKQMKWLWLLTSEHAFLDERILVALCDITVMKRIKCESMSLFMSEHWFHGWKQDKCTQVLLICEEKDKWERSWLLTN